MWGSRQWLPAQHRMRWRRANWVARFSNLAACCPPERHKPAQDCPTQEHIHQGDPNSRLAVPVRCQPAGQQIRQYPKHKQYQGHRSHQFLIVPHKCQRDNNEGTRRQPYDHDQSKQVVHLPPPRKNRSRGTRRSSSCSSIAARSIAPSQALFNGIFQPLRSNSAVIGCIERSLILEITRNLGWRLSERMQLPDILV